MKWLKDYFSEIFTLLAWITLIGYVVYCTVQGIKTDSVRDAWNILILISGFVWGSKHQKAVNANNEATTTADISATITTTPTEETKG